jgi:hypothetical protein
MPAPQNQDLDASGVASPAAGPSSSGAPGRNPGVVLVYGAYADGSSWSEVVGRLQQAGLTATAVQNPLTWLADDVAHTGRSRTLYAGSERPPCDSFASRRSLLSALQQLGGVQARLRALDVRELDHGREKFGIGHAGKPRTSRWASSPTP